MASSANILRRLIRWAMTSRNSADDAEWPVQQFSYLGKVADAVNLFPYGYHANVPAGQLSLLMCLQGKAEARVALPGSPLERPRVASDEVVVYHPVTGSMVHFRSNGDIEVTTDNDQKVHLLRDRIKVDTPYDVDVDAGGDVDVDAGGDVAVNAATISLIATGNVTITAGGALALSSTGTASLDGSIVNLGGGGNGVARIGDHVDDPSDTIDSGSAKVFSG